MGLKDYPYANDIFGSEKAGMILMGTWYGTQMTRAGVDDYKKTYGLSDDPEFVPVQYPDVKGDGKLGPMTIGPDGIGMVSRTASNKDATWAFFEYLLSEEVQKIQNADRFQIPSLSTVKLDPKLALTGAARRPGVVREANAGKHFPVEAPKARHDHSARCCLATGGHRATVAERRPG